MAPSPAPPPASSAVPIRRWPGIARTGRRTPSIWCRVDRVPLRRSGAPAAPAIAAARTLALGPLPPRSPRRRGHRRRSPFVLSLLAPACSGSPRASMRFEQGGRLEAVDLPWETRGTPNVAAHRRRERGLIFGRHAVEQARSRRAPRQFHERRAVILATTSRRAAVGGGGVLAGIAGWSASSRGRRSGRSAHPASRSGSRLGDHVEALDEPGRGAGSGRRFQHAPRPQLDHLCRDGGRRSDFTCSAVRSENSGVGGLHLARQHARPHALVSWRWISVTFASVVKLCRWHGFWLEVRAWPAPSRRFGGSLARSATGVASRYGARVSDAIGERSAAPED